MDRTARSVSEAKRNTATLANSPDNEDPLSLLAGPYTFTGFIHYPGNFTHVRQGSLSAATWSIAIELQKTSQTVQSVSGLDSVGVAVLSDSTERSMAADNPGKKRRD